MNRTTITLCLVCAALAGVAGELADRFRSPPRTAAPHVWWHWMNGNVTRDGIVADLDAMAAVGIGGATIFDVGVGIPPGPVKFNTQEWIDTVAFAVAEAAKRRIEICLHNCSGYSTSGGPWIAPSNSMKVVSYSLVDVAGPRRFAAALSAPPNKYGFYEDVAVLAWPVPAAERLPDGAAGKITEVKRDGKEIVYEFEYPADFRASLWECRILDAAPAWMATIEATLSAADADGNVLQTERGEDSLHGGRGERRRHVARDAAEPERAGVAARLGAEQRERGDVVDVAAEIRLEDDGSARAGREWLGRHRQRLLRQRRTRTPGGSPKCS